MFETLLEIGGNFLDNITGGWLSGPSRDEERQRIADARQDQDRYAGMQQNQLQHNIGIAKEHGIDPLAVIGTNQGAVTAGSIGATPMPQINQSQLGFGDIQENRLRREILTEQKEGLRLDNLKKQQELNPPPSQPQQGKLSTDKTRLPIGELGKGAIGIDPKGAEWVTYVTMPNGGLKAVPSESLKQLIEDSPYEYEHLVKEAIMPYLNGGTPPPLTEQMKQNHITWKFDKYRGGWFKQTQRPVKAKKGLEGAQWMFDKFFNEGKSN